MASKLINLSRLALQASFLSRSFNFTKNSLIYHLTKFKVRIFHFLLRSYENISFVIVYQNFGLTGCDFIYFQRNSRNRKLEPVILAFLSLPFTNKKEKEPKMTDELKIQYEKADNLFDENKFQETFDYLKSLSVSPSRFVILKNYISN